MAVVGSVLLKITHGIWLPTLTSIVQEVEEAEDASQTTENNKEISDQVCGRG